MSKHLLKTMSLLLAAIMLFSNMAVFADSKDSTKYKAYSSTLIKEYVKTGEITEINSKTITLGEKSYKSMFKLSDKTTILDANDAKIKFSDLKKGMSVEIVYNKVSKDKKDKVNNAISVKVIKNSDSVAQIKNAIIDEITVNSKNETSVTIMYETLDNRNRVVDNFMVLLTDKDTKVYNQFGEIIKISALKKGMIVNVEHSLKMTKSAVPQAYAYKISVVKSEDNTQITESKILNVYTNNKKSYILVGDANDITKQILFILADNATIKNKFNQAISFDDLAIGQKIRVNHSMAMTFSLPPQSTAYSVEVLDELKTEFIEDAVIEEIDLKGKTVTASYEVKVGTRYYENTIILTVDDKTIILDKKGKAIALKDLKLGMVIDIKHEYLPVLSSPPKSYAHKISVVSDNYQVPIDDENCEIFNLFIKLYFETDKKEWMNCIKNHDHNWKYLDKFDIEDFFEDLFERYMED